MLRWHPALASSLMAAVDRSEAATLLFRHWGSSGGQDSHRQSETEYLAQADEVVRLLDEAAAIGEVAEYLAHAGPGDRDEDRDWHAAVRLKVWYEHRVTTDPWSVQVEFDIDEPLHHGLVEDAARRLAPQGGDCTQAVGVVVFNMWIAVHDPVEAIGEALRLAKESLPGPHLIYRLTVWRHIV